MSSTFGGWTEGIVLSSIFLVLLGVVVVDMNNLYDDDVAIDLIQEMEIDSIVNSTSSYQESSGGILQEASVEKGADGGLSFLETWSLVNSLRTLIWNVITGGWLGTILVSYLGLPASVFYLLRGLWIITMVLLVVRLFMKVKP